MSASLVASPPNIALSGNPVIYRIQSTGYSGLANYRIVLKVLFEKVLNSGTFEELAELEDFPDADGFTNWDIRSIIGAALLQHTMLQVPAIASPEPYVADNARRFRISFAEKYGQPAAAQPFSNSTIATALHGGIDMHFFSDSPDYLGSIDATNSFLTWQPDGQRLSAEQPSYLTLFTKTFVEVVREVKTYGFDGNLISAFNIAPTVNLQGKESLVIPVGPAQLGVTDTAVAKYTLQLRKADDDAAIAPLRTFYLDWARPSSCGAGMLWFNSFNLPETLRLTGRKGIELEVEREEHFRNLKPGFNPLEGELVQHGSRWENLFTYRSGYLRKKEVDALQDMLVRNLLFEITGDGYYRMHLTGKKYPVTECLQFLHSLEFRAVRSIRPMNFSRVALGSTAGNGFWETSNTGYYLTASGGRFELTN